MASQHASKMPFTLVRTVSPYYINKNTTVSTYTYYITSPCKKKLTCNSVFKIFRSIAVLLRLLILSSWKQELRKIDENCVQIY